MLLLAGYRLGTIHKKNPEDEKGVRHWSMYVPQQLFQPAASDIQVTLCYLYAVFSL